MNPKLRQDILGISDNAIELEKMRFRDNKVPNGVRGMYDEIIRMKDHDEAIAACLTADNIKTDPLSAFIMLAYTALRQKEMWREALEQVNIDLGRATGEIK